RTCSPYRVEPPPATHPATERPPTERGAVLLPGDEQALHARGVVDQHRVAVADLAREQRLGQSVADRRLDEPAQRSGPVDRVVAVAREPTARRCCHLQDQPALGQAPLEGRQLYIYNGGKLVERQRAEDHNVVEPVEEFGLELGPYDRQHGVTALFIGERGICDRV